MLSVGNGSNVSVGSGSSVGSSAPVVSVGISSVGVMISGVTELMIGLDESVAGSVTVASVMEVGEGDKVAVAGTHAVRKASKQQTREKRRIMPGL